MKNSAILNIGKMSALTWITLILTAFLLGLALMVIPKSYAVEQFLEVYQQKDNKIFGQSTSLNIFDDDNLSYLNGKKLIAPFSNGSYAFAVFNNSNGNNMPYTIEIKTINDDNIPLVFNIVKNAKDIYATPAEKPPIDVVDLPEGTLRAKSTDQYIINWEWKTESDEIDTNEFGNADHDQFFTLIINAEGSLDVTDSNYTEDSGPVTKPPVNPPVTPAVTPPTIEVTDEPEIPIAPPTIVPPVSPAVTPEPPAPTPQAPTGGSGMPRTGDDADAFLWIAMAIVCILLLVLLIIKRRKNDDEKKKAGNKNN